MMTAMIDPDTIVSPEGPDPEILARGNSAELAREVRRGLNALAFCIHHSRERESTKQYLVGCCFHTIERSVAQPVVDFQLASWIEVYLKDLAFYCSLHGAWERCDRWLALGHLVMRRAQKRELQKRELQGT